MKWLSISRRGRDFTTFLASICAGPIDATVWLGTVFAQVQQFYKMVRQQQQHGSKAPPTTLPDIPGLLAVLRGYQRRGVGWMLEREGAWGKCGGEDEETSLHVLWRKLPLSTPVFFNPFTARHKFFFVISTNSLNFLSLF